MTKYLTRFLNKPRISKNITTNHTYIYNVGDKVVKCMTRQNKIQLFEQKKVRTAWDEEQEKWFFAIVDVVEALTDSVNPTDYIKKMKRRDPILAQVWGQIAPPLSIPTVGGKQKINCADTQGIFRLIQSIPSPKAEPFKQWMAQVASERLDQMQDPELSVEQAMTDYRRLGYSENWINQRIKTIEESQKRES